MKTDEKRSSVRKEKKQGEPDNTMINVLIADDHPVVRQGIKQILAEDTEQSPAAPRGRSGGGYRNPSGGSPTYRYQQ